MTTIKPDDNPVNKTNILGIGISAVTMESTIQQISAWIENHDQQYVCITNVYSIMLTQRDPTLQKIFNRAGMATPDGMPLVWLSHLHGKKNVQRVYGPDLLLAVCERSKVTQWRHYFYGGAPGVAELLSQRLKEKYPHLNIVGCDTPPFRPLTEEEDQAAIEKINASGAHIVWVGMSTPKQDRWMSAHLGKITTPVMIGVGAAFDFHAGIKPQAPRWMQRNGLEWLFRLYSEPRRLWRRYLISNPAFIFHSFLQLTGLRKYPMDELE